MDVNGEVIRVSKPRPRLGLGTRTNRNGSADLLTEFNSCDEGSNYSFKMEKLADILRFRDLRLWPVNDITALLTFTFEFVGSNAYYAVYLIHRFSRYTSKC